LEVADIDKAFPIDTQGNVGVLLGEPSGGLVDLDLDCPEVRAAAVHLAPATPCVCGRRSATNSHRGYVVTDPPKKATDPRNDPLRGRGKGARLLELRSTGSQTILPPSLLPGDSDVGKIEEPCEWKESGVPARVELAALVRAVDRIAAAALLGRYWPVGARHDCALALVGGLLRASWTPEEVTAFVRAVSAAAGDAEVEDRVRSVESTVAKLREGKVVTGWPRLAELLGTDGSKIVTAVRKWCGIAPDSGRPDTLRDRVCGQTSVPRSSVEIICEWLHDRYQPVFRRRSGIVTSDGEDVSRVDALATPDSSLIELLAEAADAPRYTPREGQIVGDVKRGALPALFKKWSPVAWGDLLAQLPDEDTAELGAGAPVGVEFRRMVRDALLTEITLGDRDEKEVERRSVIDWCEKFAKPGTWKSLRSKKIWCKVADLGGGEIKLKVAIRHELFAQLKADKRLTSMPASTFTRRAAQYGVGTSSRQHRPEGQSAIVLADGFVSDLRASCDADDIWSDQSAAPPSAQPDQNPQPPERP
jgi:hypothetical protein